MGSGSAAAPSPERGPDPQPAPLSHARESSDRSAWDALASDVADAELRIEYGAEPPAHARRLMETLGVQVAVREGQPTRVVPCARMEAAIPAHDLVQTVDCKRPNCDQPAVSNFGRWAKLCQDHADAAKAEAREAGTFGSANGNGNGNGNGHGTLAEKAKVVERAARDVDKTVARLKTARRTVAVERDRVRPALEQFIASVDELKHAAAEILRSDD